MNIRHMQSSDIDFAAGCAKDVGWTSTTREAFETSLAYDPNGCFIAEVDGRRIGLCIATNYGQSGFVGDLIVIEDMRGRGIGHRMLEHATNYLRSCGTQNIFLDGVPSAISLYERVGFRKVCRSLRFAGKIQGQSHPRVRAIQARDLEAISEIDRKAFGAARRFFLERCWSLYPELCKIMDCDGEVLGFIMGQRGSDVVSVGPWVATCDAERPGDLLEGLAAEVGDLNLTMGVLETNSAAVATIRSLGLVERREPSWRMVLGSSSDLGSSSWSYAIGSPAKG